MTSSSSSSPLDNTPPECGQNDEEDFAQNPQASFQIIYVCRRVYVVSLSHRCSTDPLDTHLQSTTYLRRRQVAETWIGAIDGSLLNDAVAGIAIAQVIRAETVLPVKHSPTWIETHILGLA